jgi:acyl carrier protein
MESLKPPVRAFVVENFLFGNDRGLTDSASLLGQGIIDSTGVLELVAFLEREFRIRIEDEEMLPENLDSIEKIAVFVARKGAPA